jgi:hypothetical protein
MQCMQQISVHKINVQSSNPSHAYPIIRLPRKFVPVIGARAHIYQVDNNGKPASFITVDKSVDKFCTDSESNNIESRLTALESSINEIKNLLFQSNHIFNSQSIKEVEGKGRGLDSNPCGGLHGP